MCQRTYSLHACGCLTLVPLPCSHREQHKKFTLLHRHACTLLAHDSFRTAEYPFQASQAFDEPMSATFCPSQKADLEKAREYYRVMEEGYMDLCYEDREYQRWETGPVMVGEACADCVVGWGVGVGDGMARYLVGEDIERYCGPDWVKRLPVQADWLREVWVRKMGKRSRLVLEEGKDS